ncbi:MAG TPA: ArsR family transcriptional regulator [Planctomycetaceae bacterium]|nr:ArsR family transcriptional regulator [Planctomycetaceae bacterium]
MSLADQSLNNADPAEIADNAGVSLNGVAGAVGTIGRSDRTGEPLRWVDSQLLQALCEGGQTGIGDLISKLGVTATAIRQRIERLLDAGLIEREKVVSGRGRPSFVYRLTDRGRWCAGADPSDLAEAMWQEILELDDSELRSRLLGGVAKRIGRRFADRFELGDDGQANALDDRMRHLVDLLAERRIATKIVFEALPVASLPVLDVQACPYPALRDATEDRSMCQLETAMLSEALGQPIRLSSCLLDGDPVCRFVPAAGSGDADR